MRKIQQLQNEVSSLQRKQEEQRQEVDEMRRQRANAEREKSSYDWIISRDEVQVTDKSLGSGGWGMVYEGRYCGCAVAVKQIREDFAPAKGGRGCYMGVLHGFRGEQREVTRYQKSIKGRTT